MTGNAEYVRLQVERIQQASASAFEAELRDRLREDNFVLCILDLDMRRSAEMDPALFERARDALVLVAATDVVARGGFMLDRTDGLEAAFLSPDACATSALALHGRRPELRRCVLEPLLDPESPGRESPSIDYRLCLSLFPAERLRRIVDTSSDEHVCAQRVKDKWRIGRSRLGNDESFLVDANLLPYLGPLQRHFDDGRVIAFRRLKGSENEQLEFWSKGFRQFAGATAPQPAPGSARPAGPVAPAALEQQHRDSWQSRRDGYQAGISALRENGEMFRAYPLEAAATRRSGIRAVVVGDVNVDYVTSMTPEEARRACSGGHTQAQRPISKSLGGKGWLTATALVEHEGIVSVDLVAKLGVDLEMQYFLGELKKKPTIRPRLFLSPHKETGTTISVRMADSMVAVLTVTNKPNANSALTKEEAAYLMPELSRADVLVISGYCLLDRDERRPFALDLIEAVHSGGGKVVVELSPSRLLAEMVVKDAERHRELSVALRSTDLVVYERDPFWDLCRDFEEKVLSQVPNALRLQFGHSLLERRTGADERWQAMPITGIESRTDEAPSGMTSLGLMSRLLARHVNDAFLSPRTLLCSESPRRRELLEDVYGRGAVYVNTMGHAQSVTTPPSKAWRRVASRTDMTDWLLALALGKMRNHLHATVDASGSMLGGCRVAIASELAIAVEGESGGLDVLGRPDELADPPGAAQEQLRSLSGRTHLAVSVTVLVDLKKLRHGSLHWTHEDIDHHLKDGAAVSLTATRGAPPLTKSFVVETKVTFRALEDDEIKEYTASGEWRTKAGSYALQGSGSYFIDAVDGSVSNVLGLPIVEVAHELPSYGVHPAR